MPFFLVKVADEVGQGDFSGAVKTLTGGIEPELQVLETDTGAAIKEFLAAFAPAEVKTILSSLVTTVESGVKTGVAALTTGTVTDAVAAGGVAAGALATDAAGSNS